MAHPLGQPQLANGTGTTPSDMQLLLAQRWASQGRIAGCALTRSASLMRYTVGEGSAIVYTAANRAVEVPITATNLTAPSAPAARTDYIMCRPDGTLAVQSSPPAVGAGAVLWEVRVPQGMTNTNQATVVKSDAKAKPAIDLGPLATWVSTAGAGTFLNMSEGTITLMSATVPATVHPRSVELTISHQMESTTSAQGAFRYDVYLNGAFYAQDRLSYDPTGASDHTHFYMTLPANRANTISVQRTHYVGPTAKFTDGGRPGFVKLTDQGVDQA